MLKRVIVLVKTTNRHIKVVMALSYINLNSLEGQIQHKGILTRKDAVKLCLKKKINHVYWRHMDWLWLCVAVLSEWSVTFAHGDDEDVLLLLILNSISILQCWERGKKHQTNQQRIIAALSTVWSSKRTCRGVAECLALRTCIAVVTQRALVCGTGNEEKSGKKALFL